MPAETPSTLPTAGAGTEATPVLEELHVPPVVLDDKVIVVPLHKEELPLIADTVGVVSTESRTVTKQPPGKV